MYCFTIVKFIVPFFVAHSLPIRKVCEWTKFLADFIRFIFSHTQHYQQTTRHKQSQITAENQKVFNQWSRNDNGTKPSVSARKWGDDHQNGHATSTAQLFVGQTETKMCERNGGRWKKNRQPKLIINSLEQRYVLFTSIIIILRSLAIKRAYTRNNKFNFFFRLFLLDFWFHRPVGCVAVIRHEDDPDGISLFSTKVLFCRFSERLVV